MTEQEIKEYVDHAVEEALSNAIELTDLDDAPTVEGTVPLIQNDNLYGLDLSDMVSISSAEIASWFNDNT